ncbi:MAG: hypothetical protein WC619_00285 [Patescibacteria group bacterium]
MKNIFKKSLKFISSRLFYLVIGIFLAISATYVYATWDTAKTSGSGKLTEANWNELVTMVQSDLSALNAKVDNMSSSGAPYINWNDCEVKTAYCTQFGNSNVCCSSGYTLVTSNCSVSGTDVSNHTGSCNFSSTSCLYLQCEFYSKTTGSIKCCKYVTP